MASVADKGVALAHKSIVEGEENSLLGFCFAVVAGMKRLGR